MQIEEDLQSAEAVSLYCTLVTISQHFNSCYHYLACFQLFENWNLTFSQEKSRYEVALNEVVLPKIKVAEAQYLELERTRQVHQLTCLEREEMSVIN